MANFSTLRLKLMLTGAVMLCPTPVLAQSAGAEDSQPSDQLDVIIVTATKRSADVQTVPVAVSAMSSEFLERENIETIDDIRNRVPSLQSYSFNVGIEASRVFRRLLFVRRSHNERYKEQVFT
jgi:outer membrane cobalamin receptor